VTSPSAALLQYRVPPRLWTALNALPCSFVVMGKQMAEENEIFIDEVNNGPDDRI
jgi:hypothetical protein